MLTGAKRDSVQVARRPALLASLAGLRGVGAQSFWVHLRTWRAIRDLPNVLLVHYARLKADLPSEMRRVAAFLDIPIDEARWEALLEHCSFDWMKANANRTAIAIGTLVAWDEPETFFHRGVNGRWAETLLPEETKDD
jgi:aryl sulfotransferase